jgi:3-isopropylmalate dehydratase small subunit
MDAEVAAREARPESDRRPSAGKPGAAAEPRQPAARAAAEPLKVSGRVWMVGKDNIDTDMIYHNKHLAVTDVAEMAKYCFGNLEGWQDFPGRVKPGDIVIVGKNFGCGSSRQHAVDCFKSLGVQAIIGQSFGAIYERNAINGGLPIVEGDVAVLGLRDGDTVTVDFITGVVTKEATGQEARVRPFSEVQMDIYKRGGLLNK